MTDDLLFSKVTINNIERFIAHPSHAVLLVAPTGMGKLTTSKYLASKLLGLNNIDGLSRYPYFYNISPVNNLISIDQIRELREIFRLKTTGKNQLRRVVVIDGAHYMNNEAQNALLKLLEEPPQDSVLILTADYETSLKATVVSRSQILRIHRPLLNQATDYFKKFSYSEDDIKKAYLFSAGASGMMSAILNHQDSSDLLSYLNDAKALLSANRFTKLTKVDEWSKDKPTLPWKLYALKRVCNAALIQSVEKNQLKLIKRWYNSEESIMASEFQLVRNVNTKLLLTNLFMDL